MKLTRRKLLGTAAATLGGSTAADALTGCAVPQGATRPNGTHKEVGEARTICPFCAVGCGMVVGVEDGSIVNIEGDPDHPINRGTLCSKGSTLSQLVASDQRITTPLYRAPGATEWQEVEWDWALGELASRIKGTRDEHWIERDAQRRVVRRTEAIASVGSAALDNEECSLLVKALRALGLVYIEHQARI